MAKVLVPVEIDGLLDVDDAADQLNKGVATIWRWIRDGKIAVAYIGEGVSRRTLIPATEIERINNQATE